jgi:hypothetical protein
MKMDQKHSGFGIASFVISLLAGLLLFLTFVAIGMVSAASPEGIDEDSPIALLLGLLILAFMALAMIGLGLGIAGCCQPNRLKVFPVLGVVFSALSVIVPLGLILVGLSIE